MMGIREQTKVVTLSVTEPGNAIWRTSRKSAACMFRTSAVCPSEFFTLWPSRSVPTCPACPL